MVPALLWEVPDKRNKTALGTAGSQYLAVHLDLSSHSQVIEVSYGWIQRFEFYLSCTLGTGVVGD